MKLFYIKEVSRDKGYYPSHKKIGKQKNAKREGGVVEKRGEKIKMKKGKKGARAAAPGTVDAEVLLYLTVKERDAFLFAIRKKKSVKKGYGKEKKREKKKRDAALDAYSFFIIRGNVTHKNLLFSFLLIISRKRGCVKTRDFLKNILCEFSVFSIETAKDL